MSSAEIVNALGWALLQSDIRHNKEQGSFPLLGEDFDFLATAFSSCRESRAQLAQDLWVLYELKGKRGGFFVEFGAGDGVILSNTWLLESKFQWKGVLAEPLPRFEKVLRANRTSQIFMRCVSDRSGGCAAFIETPDPLFSSLERFAYEDAHADTRRAGRRLKVQTQSLTDLLREAQAPRLIDYLSVDTEGNEYEVLAAFDFSEYEISLLTVEHNHTRREAQLDALLGSKGFVRKFAHLSDFDAWYVNPRSFETNVEPRPSRPSREGFWQSLVQRFSARGRTKGG